MSLEIIFRLAGMAIFAIVGLQIGVRLSELAGGASIEVWAMVVSLIGALFGLVLTPHFTTRPARMLRNYLSELPAQQLVAGTIGLIIGLIVAALVSLPLSLLPPPYNAVLPVLAAILFSYFGTAVMASRRHDVFELFRAQIPSLQLNSSDKPDGGLTSSRQVLLDTSVIIDGRIADISQTGFIMGPMLVPRFVLNELQYIADSPDAVRRNRGHRGLDILNQLQKDSLVPVQITDMDVEGVEAVDEKLILLGKKLGCAIITNDFNLNRVAKLQGVMVLNINDLANAVKTVYLPGEEMEIAVIQEGREYGQGVGYLDDGTMVVIEGGRRHLNQTIQATVTKVLQTAAGRMIFARPNSNNSN